MEHKPYFLDKQQEMHILQDNTLFELEELNHENGLQRVSELQSYLLL